MKKQEQRLFKKWEKKLKDEGLPADLVSTTTGLKGEGWATESLETLRLTTLRIQERLDAEVEEENRFSSSLPIGKCGLPPCLRVRHGRDGS